MLLHSIVPAEYLLAQMQPQNSLEELSFSGGYLQGRRTEQGFEITRLISTDPALYLKPNYTPGTLLEPVFPCTQTKKQ